MRKLLALVMLMPMTAFAQLQEPDDEIQTEYWFQYGSNWSSHAWNDVTYGGNNYEHYVDYSWHSFLDDEEEEPLDEIVVIGERQSFLAGWQLYAYLNLNLTGQEICTNYTDGGHCNVYEYVYDAENMPLEGGCQTIQGTTAPLTAQQANQLNNADVQSNAVGPAGTRCSFGR